MGRSGRAIAKLLFDVGAKVFCSDSGNVEGLESLGLPFETGGHSERVFTSDIIVVSRNYGCICSALADLAAACYIDALADHVTCRC